MTTPPPPPPMPAQPPSEGTPSPAFQVDPAAPAAPTPSGGLLTPVSLARPSRDASGGSAAYTSQGDPAGTDSKPGKAEKNTAPPGMWKGIAAFIANRPQRKMTVQHTIAELRGSSTDRKINHGVTEKRGSTSDSKSSRTATTAHTAKSDKSAKTADTRDAKTSSASTKADKNSRDAKTADTRSAAKRDSRDAKTADTRATADRNSRDARTADTRASSDKNSRDTKAASDRKDHDTRQRADRDSAGKQDRTDRTTRGGRNSLGPDKAGKAPEPKPASTPPAPKTPAPGAATAPDPAKTADNPKPGRKPKPEPQTKPGPESKPESRPGADSTPGTPLEPEPSAKKDHKPRKGPYTSRPAREDGFNTGAQEAAVEADKAAWRDGYEDGQKAIRERAAHDKAQLDAARDRAHQPLPEPPKTPAPPGRPEKHTAPPNQPTTPPKPTVPPRPAGPPPKPTGPPAAQSKQQSTPSARERPQGAPPVKTTPATTRATTPQTPAPAMGPVPLGAAMTPYGNAVALSNGRVMPTGEVQSLRKFTRFLAGREQETQQIADGCKQAQAVSANRVNEIQHLIEACRDPKIKAGKNLIASLQKLHEATTAQAKEAEKLAGNAVRAIEALRTLNQNTEVRHGGVYRAVVDSDETTPAERAFYQR
ncbi:hypothetical protein [Streptomyces griseus]|uniref:hypothetical protein n=1 Tax=Streptomyces griseus TaxID=1911 RepID=UPI0036F984CA